MVFRSSTEHRLQAQVLTRTVSSATTDGNGTAPYSQPGSRDVDPVSILKSRGAGAQNSRLHWLHPTAALLTYIHQGKFRFSL